MVLSAARITCRPAVANPLNSSDRWRTAELMRDLSTICHPGEREVRDTLPLWTVCDPSSDDNVGVRRILVT